MLGIEDTDAAEARRVGAFELDKFLAKGGMGAVWLAHRVSDGSAAVVKLIMGDLVQDEEYRRLFGFEARAMARLEHPNIVRVLDYGDVDEGAEDAGVPFLAMEFAGHGDLDDWEVGDWSTLVYLISGVLRGLAHAHGKGLIHRDIKPANILLGGPEEAPKVMLTDFGIAYVLDRHTASDSTDITSRSTEAVSGTPQYMSPEQFMGTWRDYGPWTDLYAVGILAFSLATKSLPFKAESFMHLAVQHMSEPVPPAKPTFPVPDGFDAWLAWMTAKETHHRMPSAADAVALLEGLGTPAVDAILHGPPSQRRPGLRAFRRGAIDVPDVGAGVDTAFISQSAMSDGLGLFEVREGPFVGRNVERARAWEALRTALGGTPSCVILHGEAGVGKTRLASWLTQNAAELGLANALFTTHEEVPGPLHGVVWLLHQYFRSAGLNRSDTFERVSDVMARDGVTNEQEIHLVSSVLAPPGDDGSVGIPDDQILQVSIRALTRAASRQPLIVALDDAHWSPTSLTFAHRLLEQSAVPILVVLTVRSDILAEQAETRARLAPIVDKASCNLTLGPMDNSELSSLLRSRLALPDDLVSKVIARAKGSPLFATKLLGGWVDEGVITLEDGVVVVDASTLELPEDQADLWGRRIDRLVEDLTQIQMLPDGRLRIAADAEAVQQRLFVAAALGRDVLDPEWRAVCERLQLKPVPWLVDALSRHGLGTAHENGFSFAHGSIRDVLAERARANNMWRKVNGACAQALTSLYVAEFPALSLRVARHFLSARSYIPATLALVHATKTARGASDVVTASEAARLLTKCLHKMKAPPQDPGWLQVHGARSYELFISREKGSVDKAREMLDQLLADMQAGGNPNHIVEAMSSRALASLYDGTYRAGADVLEPAINMAEKPESRWNAALILSQLRNAHGDTDAALHWAEQALGWASEPAAKLRCHQVIARAFLERDDLGPAEIHINHSIALSRSLGFPMGEARCYETKAFIMDAHGNYAECEELHRKAAELFELLAPQTTYPDKQWEYVARAAMAQGKWTEARVLIEPLAAAAAAGQAGFYTHLHDVLLACAAGEEQWELFVSLIDEATDFAFPPFNLHVRALQKAAELAVRSHRTVYAKAILQRVIAIEDLDAELKAPLRAELDRLG